MEHHGFNWFSLLPGYHGGSDHIIGAILVTLILFVLGVMCYSRFKRQEIVPSAKFSLTTPFEIITDMLLSLQENIIGPHHERYLPLTGSIFIFILFSNLLGMVPGFVPPTQSFFTNLALAIVVVGATHYYGVKTHGLAKYGKHFLAPIAGIGGILLSLLFTPIELVSHLFRVVSLPLRLWGNIFADHTVLGIMEGLFPVILPLPFIVLGLMVAVVQAFIFALLTMIYIGLATAEEH
jgi:F-type H+-transporting ATPase subunit a